MTATEHDETLGYTAGQIERYHLDSFPLDPDDPESARTWGVFIDRPAGTCACGCGQAVIREGATFRQGHDQRLMGTLQFAHRNGLTVFVTQGGIQVGMTAEQYGAEVLTATGQIKLQGYLVAPAKSRKADPSRFVAKPGDFREPTKDEAITEAPKMIRVGRWEYPVVRIEAVGSVVYRDRSGAEKVKAA